MSGSKKPQMRIKISIRTNPVLVDPIGDFLLGLTEAGVEIHVDDNEDWQTLNVYLGQVDIDEGERDRMLEQIRVYLSELATIFQVELPYLEVSGYAEEDWGSSWKKHFVPFAIVPGLVIAPTWENYEAASGELVIVMDPGMAFGTGHHATTSMSLSLVREVLKDRDAGRLVLDVGTGTGILAMAAAAFGALKVLAIDNDPLAVAAAEENVRRNGFPGSVEVSGMDLESVQGEFSLIVANIIHNTLLQMAANIVRLLAVDGSLVLSGILQGQQASQIIRCFEGMGCEVLREEHQGEWAALLLRKKY